LARKNCVLLWRSTASQLTANPIGFAADLWQRSDPAGGAARSGLPGLFCDYGPLV
jgi:hypothetical protein